MDMGIFFVDEHNSSRQNGIGTYRDVLIRSLHKYHGLKITLISLNADCKTLTVTEHDFGYEYALPPVGNGNWRANGNIVWPLLRLYINDSKHNVFIFNHSPSAEFIRAMKSQFSESKSIFIIHDQGWCAPLLGRRKLLGRVLRNAPTETDGTRIEEYCRKEQEIYNEVDKVVSLCESTEVILRRTYHIQPQKTVRIENGFNRTMNRRTTNRAKLRSEFGLNDDEKILLFVGRPAYHKGAAALMDALQYLNKKHIAVRCVFAGNIHGFADYIASHKDIAANVILTGQLTRKELAGWYSIADVGVLSSYTEQCSYAALEMMDAGIPIVSSDGYGLCDMFNDGENAFVVHIGDGKTSIAYSRRLADAIEQALCASEEQKRRYAAYNRRLLRTRYSASAMAEKYIGLFCDIISGEYITP